VGAPDAQLGSRRPSTRPQLGEGAAVGLWDFVGLWPTTEGALVGVDVGAPGAQLGSRRPPTRPQLGPAAVVAGFVALFELEGFATGVDVGVEPGWHAGS
jgi:hypothetical protein